MAKKIKTTKSKFTAPVSSDKPMLRTGTEEWRAERRAKDPYPNNSSFAIKTKTKRRK